MYGLDPIDWFWAAWRRLPPLPRPTPRPFNQGDVLRRLSKVTQGSYGWDWRWEQARITPALTREEAHFWLVAMACACQSATPAELADDLAELSFSGDLGYDQVLRLLDTSETHTKSELIVPLTVLLSPEELVDLLTRQYTGERLISHPSMLYDLHKGFRTSVLPYLSLEERARLSVLVAPLVAPEHWPDHISASASPAFYLAALLGGHEAALLELVRSWPDDRYRADWHDYQHRPQEIVFGLARPALVEREMRRLGLRLNKPAYARAWLAHTGLEALDLLRDSIRAETRPHVAAALAGVLARATDDQPPEQRQGSCP
ncbi:MAG TPA: hypothetical protein VFS21_01330 [Roseiflexaceae bacterium]|nr:hypothetical protein [Roseiflexaceae bacterium]